MQQAVACAKTATAPFLAVAVAVLPAWDDSPFSRVLARHADCCHTLAQVPAGYFNFDRPEYAPRNGRGNVAPANRAHFAVKIVLIHNPTGLREYLNREAFDPFCQEVIAHALRTRYPTGPLPGARSPKYRAVCSKLTFAPPPDPEHPLPDRPPRPWMKTLIARLRTAPSPPGGAARRCTGPETVPAAPPFPFAAETAAPPLGADPNGIVYTDASLARGGACTCWVRGVRPGCP